MARRSADDPPAAPPQIMIHPQRSLPRAVHGFWQRFVCARTLSPQKALSRFDNECSSEELEPPYSATEPRVRNTIGKCLAQAGLSPAGVSLHLVPPQRKLHESRDIRKSIWPPGRVAKALVPATVSSGRALAVAGHEAARRRSATTGAISAAYAARFGGAKAYGAAAAGIHIDV